MTEQSADLQEPARSDWHTPAPTAAAISIGSSGVRTSEKVVCPGCGETVQRRMEACPACGENLHQAPKRIRCMYCTTTASSELVVCPGCGRELREAPPKLLRYGAPALLALLLATVIITQWERISPIAWARTNLLRGVVLVEDISASIEPEVVIVMTPISDDAPVMMAIVANDDTNMGSAPVVVAESIAFSETQVVALQSQSAVTPIPEVIGNQGEGSAAATEVAVEESPVGIGGPEQSEQRTNSAPESLPTLTPTVTDTPLPTDTPLAVVIEAKTPQANAPTLTPTPTWTTQATATSIATAHVVVTQESSGGMAQIAALAANETVLPTATAIVTDSTTPLPTPSPTPVVYQVKSGDTLVTIAATYEVEVDALMEANDISAEDVYVLQPGQMIFIPSPTPDPSIRVEAPLLLAPPTGATVGCKTGGKLIWQRVQFVKDSDKYMLHLGFVSGQTSDGAEDVTWILAQSGPVTQTEWELDTSLCELAPADHDHQWRWWVEVVENADGGTLSVSPRSEIFSFVWQ